MKFLKLLYRFLYSFILFIGLLCLYNVSIITQWIQQRLLDKFTIVVTLRENVDSEEIIKFIEITKGHLQLKDIKYMDKNSVYEEAIKNGELKTITSVLKNNPFSDIVKLKLKMYSEKEFKEFLKFLKENTYIKEIIYDYNITTYLSRIQVIFTLINKIKVLIFVLGLIFIFVYVLLYGQCRISFLYTLLCSIIIFVILLYNIKFLNLLTNSVVYGITLENIVSVVFMYTLVVINSAKEETDEVIEE
ncbi:MAG: hypothetical protein N2643_01020 [Endomicrobia bacterium]|nr:hypothetical protein [Endomicrobiia bacterium]